MTKYTVKSDCLTSSLVTVCAVDSYAAAMTYAQSLAHALGEGWKGNAAWFTAHGKTAWEISLFRWNPRTLCQDSRTFIATVTR